MSRRRILITGPGLRDEGGVANYYNAVLQGLRADERFEIEYFELGSTHRAVGPLYPVADQAGFRRLLQGFRPDLVHVNPSLTVKSFVRDGLLIHQARRRDLPVVVFFRGWSMLTEARIDREVGWLFRRTFAPANAFIVLGERFRQKLLGWGITSPILLETTTVPDSVMEGFSLERKVAAIRDDATIKVLFLARLEPEKGPMATLEAVASLVKRGVPVTLTIAGDGPAMGDLRAYLAQNAWLEGKVTLAGYVRGAVKRELFNAHHVYCFPSEYGEGMPNSVLEAMALGLPIVTTTVGGLADFFEDGRMGHLVPGRDAGAIADKLGRLVADRAASATISAYNHEYATRRFLSSDVARRLAGIYLDTLQRAGRGESCPSA